MFEDTITHLDALVKPIDFIGHTSTKKIIDETAKSIINEINHNSEIDAYLLDVLIRKDIRSEVNLVPVIEGNMYNTSSGRHRAKESRICKNGRPNPSEKGVWTWAFAFDRSIDIWIDNIDNVSHTKYDISTSSTLPLLEQGYIMTNVEIENKISRYDNVPPDAIIFGETCSMIVIPITYFRDKKAEQLGLLSIETRRGNLTIDIYKGLLRICKTLASLIWKHITSVHMKSDTVEAIDKYAETIANPTGNKTISTLAPSNLSPKPIFELLERRSYTSDVFLVFPSKGIFTDIYSSVLEEITTPLGISLTRKYISGKENYLSMSEGYSSIFYCNHVLFDCTNSEPMVLFLLGTAVAMNKKSIILISQDQRCFPSNSSYAHKILYDLDDTGIQKLILELTEVVKKF